MDPATVVAIVFGCLTLTGLLIGSAWTVSGRLGGLTVAVKNASGKTEETLKLVREHSVECDKERVELITSNRAHGHTIDDHGRRIGRLEG